MKLNPKLKDILVELILWALYIWKVRIQKMPKQVFEARILAELQKIKEEKLEK